MKHVRLLMRIHRWSGLITGINILILSLTGSYLVFTEEIANAFKVPESPALMSVAANSQYPIQAAIDTVLKHNLVFAVSQSGTDQGVWLSDGLRVLGG